MATNSDPSDRITDDSRTEWKNSTAYKTGLEAAVNPASLASGQLLTSKTASTSGWQETLLVTLQKVTLY